jgi:hypothetical protein
MHCIVHFNAPLNFALLQRMIASNKSISLSGWHNNICVRNNIWTTSSVWIVSRKSPWSPSGRCELGIFSRINYSKARLIGKSTFLPIYLDIFVKIKNKLQLLICLSDSASLSSLLTVCFPKTLIVDSPVKASRQSVSLYQILSRTNWLF